MSRASVHEPFASNDPALALRWLGELLGVIRNLCGPRYVWIKLRFRPFVHLTCSKPSPTKYGNVPPIGGSWSYMVEGDTYYEVIAPWFYSDDAVEPNDHRVRELFELYGDHYAINFHRPVLGAAT